MNVHCFTSISFAYLARARVLAASIRRFHPEWTLWICISDRAPDGFNFDLSQESFDHVIWLDSLEIPGLEAWIFKHNVVEICTAIKGYGLNHILANGAEAVIYIDPDIALFNDLTPVVNLLKENSIVLTPHLVDPESGLREIWENERSALMHGVYNLGFLAIRNDEEGRRCGQWWQDRLAAFCYEAASEGVYTDQRWCDLIPAFFDRVAVLRDPGYNVASWNISKRKIYFDCSGNLLANGVSLRFFHFTKIDHIGEVMIDRYLGESVALIEMVKWYKGALREHSVSGLPRRWWYYGIYSDGSEISHSHRKLYREREDLQSAFPRPFDAGTYLGWIRSEMPGLLPTTL